MRTTFQWLVAHRRLGGGAAVILIALAITACGSSSSKSSSSGSATSTSAAKSSAKAGAVSQSTLTMLKAYVAKAQQAPTWKAPGPAVDAKKALAGKTIVTFPISSEIDACNSHGQQGYLDSEAQQLGAKVDALTSTAGPTSWISNLNAAVTDKASAVVMLCGPTAAALAQQLTTLKAHHIPVVDGNYNQTGGNPAFPDTNLNAESGVDTVGGVQDDLADALVNLNGAPAHILFLDSTQVAQDTGALDGLKAAMSKWCSACTIEKTENFATQDWSGPKETSEIASDLQGDPKINTVIVTFDGMADGIESTVQTAASTHKGLKMYAWGGGLAEIKAVGNGGTFAGDAGPDEKWDAYDQLDQVIRLLAGKPAAPVANEVAPNIYFTKSNAASFSVGGKGTQYSDQAYGAGAFEGDFLKLWGAAK